MKLSLYSIDCVFAYSIILEIWTWHAFWHISLAMRGGQPTLSLFRTGELQACAGLCGMKCTFILASNHTLPEVTVMSCTSCFTWNKNCDRLVRLMPTSIINMLSCHHPRACGSTLCLSATLTFFTASHILLSLRHLHE